MAVTDNYAPDFISLLAKYGLFLYDVTPKLEVACNGFSSRQEEIKE